jgi:hypothetical protein
MHTMRQAPVLPLAMTQEIKQVGTILSFMDG